MSGPLEAAVRLLARREYSEQELRHKLQQQSYDPDSITDAIIRLQEKGYLDDARLIQRGIERLVADRRLGFRGIIAKLGQAGLAVSSAEVRKHYPEEAEWQVASQLVEKNFPSRTVENVNKIGRFLANRGFSAAIVNRAMEECRKHQY